MERIACLVICAGAAVVLATFDPLPGRSLTDDAPAGGGMAGPPAGMVADAPATGRATAGDGGPVATGGIDAAALGVPLRPVPDGSPAPRVSHQMIADRTDGYNVRILARNFTFTPAAIDRDVRDNMGYARVYVNGIQVARAYSSWIHLPAAMLSPGENLVTITLNANDHSAWSKDGVAISSTVHVSVPDG